MRSFRRKIKLKRYFQNAKGNSLFNVYKKYGRVFYIDMMRRDGFCCRQQLTENNNKNS